MIVLKAKQALLLALIIQHMVSQLTIYATWVAFQLCYYAAGYS